MREQFAGGRNASCVMDCMTQRYCDFVGYRPPFKPTTVLLRDARALLLLLIGAGPP